MVRDTIIRLARRSPAVVVTVFAALTVMMATAAAADTTVEVDHARRVLLPPRHRDGAAGDRVGRSGGDRHDPGAGRRAKG